MTHHPEGEATTLPVGLDLVNGRDLAVATMSSILPSARLSDLARQLESEVTKLMEGDTSSLDQMLLQQAVLLQMTFSKLLARAAQEKSPERATALYSVAFKAQAAARNTIRILHDSQNPRPVAFIRQANVAHTQQVNNGLAGTERTLAVDIAQNELVAPLHDGRSKVDR